MEPGLFGACPWCGGPVSPTAAFCGRCGRPIERVPTTSAPSAGAFPSTPAPQAPEPAAVWPAPTQPAVGPPTLNAVRAPQQPAVPAATLHAVSPATLHAVPPPLSPVPAPPFTPEPPPTQSVRAMAPATTRVDRRRPGASVILLALIASFAIIAAGVGAGLILRPRDDAAAPAGGPAGAPSPAAPTASTAATDGAPASGLTTPPLVDGFADETGLVPPIVEDGDVPAPEQPTPVSGKLSLGPATQLAAQAIGAAGGTIAVSRPGEPLDGLRLEVPAGAFAGDRTVTISSRPVTGSDYGPLVTPAGPLVTIDDGGGYADGLLRLRIPATIPDGAVAGVFYYDEVTGRLEGLPTVAVDATGITIATRHFSGLLPAIATGGLPDTVDSGFRPGVDDWQFTNRGSIIAPGGHCSGQAVSAMYYYTERRRAIGAASLFGTYDDNGGTPTPALWVDDSDGYRLASMVQHDTDFDSWAAKLFENSEKTPDAIHRMALRYAMAVTGEPQQLLIYDANGGSGHAITAYRVTRDRIFVADPNYPGRLRTIRWDDATQDLLTYSSGTNAASIAQDGAVAYEQLLYSAKSAIADWGRIGQRWAEFDAGTVGDGTFPGFVVEALAGKDAAGKEVWVPLVDGYQTPDKKLTIRLRDPAAHDSVTMRVYPGTSATPVGPFSGKQTIDLADGANPLGISEFGNRAGAGWQYVDFVRLTVTSGESSDWELADVQVKHTGISVNQDYTWSWDGDGRGGIVTTWAVENSVPAAHARLDATWQIPDRLTPGTEVDVSGSLKATLDFDSRANEFCGSGMHQLGPEDGWLNVSAVNGSGVEGASSGPAVPNPPSVRIVDVSIGCDEAAGTMVPSKIRVGELRGP